MWQYNYNVERELYHHGIIGQKWGDRNGPPYPLDKKNYNAAEKRALKKSKKLNSDAEDSLKRYDRKQRNQKIIENAFEKSEKNGKDKANISPAEAIGKNTVDALNRTSNVRNKIKNFNKDNANEYDAVSKMSDNELRERINRMNLEKQYINLSSERISTGRDKVAEVIDIAGDVMAIGVSVAGAVSLIKKIKGA